MATKQDNKVNIADMNITFNTMRFMIVGLTPLIMHRFSSKSINELLYPPPKKTAADKATTMKHDPITEYRDCFYRVRDPSAPTFFHMPNGSFKRAMAEAAKDLPGVTKAATGRLVSVVDPTIHIYGVPKMAARMVRNSDMNRTPDVRFRPFFDRWACYITVNHVFPLVKPPEIEKLMTCAGMFVGVGDNRVEKGKDNFGMFRYCEVIDDPEFHDILKTGGRTAQEQAYEAPDYFDEETRELIEWFNEEVSRRTLSKATLAETSKAKTRKTNGDEYAEAQN